ncbi:MAG: TetR/AcrR family transcriptional regulator [Acidimicrobiales bacterium]
MMARREPPVRHTKKDVAESALKLFCERGYQAVTVEEIAAVAGVTKGAFYYYFADKEDLAKDLWHELWGRLSEAAREAYDPDEGVAANMKLCFRAVLEAISGLGEARFFLREAWVLPAVEVAGRADQQAAATLVGALLAEAHSRGELGGLDVDASSRLLLGAYAEAMLHILTTGEAEATLDVLDTVIDAIVPGRPNNPRRATAGGSMPRRAGRRRTSTAPSGQGGRQ